MTSLDRDSQPDFRLVQTMHTDRRTGKPHEVVPILLRHSPSALGAYCPVCPGRPWITWVQQSERWLALEAWQKTQRDNTAEPNVTTPVESPQELPTLDNWTKSEFTLALANIAQFCYDQAGAMGFHDGMSRTVGERAMLVVTELAELFEAFRKNKYTEPSDHISDFSFAEEEWADCLVRIFDHALDDVRAGRLAEAFVAKLEFNRTRGYRHGGKRV